MSFKQILKLFDSQIGHFKVFGLQGIIKALKINSRSFSHNAKLQTCRDKKPSYSFFFEPRFLNQVRLFTKNGKLEFVLWNWQMFWILMIFFYISPSCLAEYFFYGSPNLILWSLLWEILQKRLDWRMNICFT